MAIPVGDPELSLNRAKTCAAMYDRQAHDSTIPEASGDQRADRGDRSTHHVSERRRDLWSSFQLETVRPDACGAKCTCPITASAERNRRRRSEPACTRGIDLQALNLWSYVGG